MMRRARLPAPTTQLLIRLQDVVELLDALAARTPPNKKAHAVARTSAQTVRLAIDRLEDFAILVEDLAPPEDGDPAA